MTLLPLAVTAALAFPPPAADAPRVTVIDTALAAASGTLVAIDPTGITIAPEHAGGGAARTFPLSSVALVAPEQWWSPARRWPGPIRSTTPGLPGAATQAAIVPTPILELTDGSTLPGTPRAGASPAAENTIAWEHALLGLLDFKLDQVRSVTFPPLPDSVSQSSSPGGPAAAPGKAGNDTLILRNGDRLDGFVDAIAPAPDDKDQPLAVRLEVKGVVSSIPLSRVALIRLNNPPPATRPAGVGIWLDGGTSATVSRALLADGMPLTVWTAGRSAPPRDIPAQFLRAFMPDPARLSSLAGLEITAQKPGPNRGWWRPAIVRPTSGEIAGASEVELPGPMFVEWKLPDNATRLGGWIVLPEDCRAWGECEVAVTLAAGGAGDADKELLRAKLSDAKPEAPLNLELPGTGARILRITLTEGSRGAVQTRAVLRRAILVCK